MPCGCPRPPTSSHGNGQLVGAGSSPQFTHRHYPTGDKIHATPRAKHTAEPTSGRYAEREKYQRWLLGKRENRGGKKKHEDNERKNLRQRADNRSLHGSGLPSAETSELTRAAQRPHQTSVEQHRSNPPRAVGHRRGAAATARRPRRRSPPAPPPHSGRAVRVHSAAAAPPPPPSTCTAARARGAPRSCQRSASASPTRAPPS